MLLIYSYFTNKHRSSMAYSSYYLFPWRSDPNWVSAFIRRDVIWCIRLRWQSWNFQGKSRRYLRYLPKSSKNSFQLQSRMLFLDVMKHTVFFFLPYVAPRWLGAGEPTCSTTMFSVLENYSACATRRRGRIAVSGADTSLGCRIVGLPLTTTLLLT